MAGCHLQHHLLQRIRTIPIPMAEYPHQGRQRTHTYNPIHTDPQINDLCKWAAHSPVHLPHEGVVVRAHGLHHNGGSCPLPELQHLGQV